MRRNSNWEQEEDSEEDKKDKKEQGEGTMGTWKKTQIWRMIPKKKQRITNFSIYFSMLEVKLKQEPKVTGIFNRENVGPVMPLFS